MILMPKAVGSAANWNKSKREYHCLSTGAPNKSEKPYVSPETEANAVLQMKGNHVRWAKQFWVAEEADYKGKTQRILAWREPEETDTDDEDEDAKAEKSKKDGDPEEPEAAEEEPVAAKPPAKAKQSSQKGKKGKKDGNDVEAGATDANQGQLPPPIAP